MVDLAAALPPSMQPMVRILTEELVGIVRSMMSEPLRAVAAPEDIAQNIRKEILSRPPGFEPRSADPERDFRSWLSTMVVHRVQDAARAAERLARSVEDEVLEDARRDGGTPSRVVAHGHAIAFMLACVGRLDATERDVLRLHFEGRLTFEQIGERTGLTEDAARRVRTRALQRLREMMGNSSNYSFGARISP
jgi:RNA polymerase sigma factor (sigma-70 family)